MKYIYIVIVSIIFLGYNSYEEDKSLPPLEIYIIDELEIPKATGEKGTTYTASIYVVNNINKKVIGPFKGSSYPNSKETPEGTDKPNTVVMGSHIFNNKYGHKGGTVKGLNLINYKKERIVNGYSWHKKPSTVTYANVHTGFSDNGNYNSRGSMGCITIHPKEVNEFWKNFDFSKKTKGTSEGIIYIFREKKNRRDLLIEQLEKLFTTK